MQKGNPWALLPIAVFLVVFIGCGILFGDFYAMPAIVGFLIALVTAFLQNPKRTFAEKLSSVTRSMGDENVMIMCLVFVLAGAFSGAVQAAGGVDSTVNFGLSILPPQIAVAGLFLIGCFISTAMGTSVGTIVALAPIITGNIVGYSSLAIGGTSIIIVVGVALETVRQLEAQMLMRHYKGFLE